MHRNTSRTSPVRLTAALLGVLTLLLLGLALGASPMPDPDPSPSREVLPSQHLFANGDFENDFNGWTAVQDVSISTTTVHGGGKALKTTDPTKTRFSYVYQELSLDYGQDEVTFWVYPESPDYVSTFELIANWQSGTATFITRVSLFTDRLAFTALDVSESIDQALTPNSWNKVMVRVDAASQTQDFFLNDVQVSSLTSLSPFPTIEHLLVGDLSGSSHYGTVYYDDISIAGTGTNTLVCPFQTDPVLAVEDETFDNVDWVTELITNTPAANPWALPFAIQAFDTPHAHYPPPGNPVPGRYTRYVYDGPAGQGAEVEAATWLVRTVMPPAEGLGAIQFDFDTWGSGQTVGPLILQGGTYYRGPTFILNRTPDWQAYSSGCLQAGDFEKRVGAGPEEPDLSQPFVVGYSLANTSDVAFDLRDHLIDNFRVFVDGAAALGDPPPIDNRAPFALDDVLVASKDASGPYVGSVEALENDIDPDGYALEIIAVTQSSQGITGISSTEGWVKYETVSSSPAFDTDSFFYTITDGENVASARVNVLIEDCPLTIAAAGTASKTSKTAALDLALIRRFRDEVMQPTAEGARYVDHYYQTTTEILKILIIDRPDLKARARGMAELLQPSMADALDGDGSLPITQAQMDTVAAFFADLSVAGSRSLQELITGELDRIGPLGAYVGRPVGEVLTTVLGPPTNTAAEPAEAPAPARIVRLENYPNPFREATRITYDVTEATEVTLTIYDMRGRRVRTLWREALVHGPGAVTWDGLDDSGFAVPSGVYVVHLSTPTYQTARTMVLRR